jgi:hypothetical protein
VENISLLVAANIALVNAEPFSASTPSVYQLVAKLSRFFFALKLSSVKTCQLLNLRTFTALRYC